MGLKRAWKFLNAWWPVGAAAEKPATGTGDGYVPTLQADDLVKWQRPLPATPEDAAEVQYHLVVDQDTLAPAWEEDTGGAGGGLSYQGTWNASTNTPTIPAAASGNNGWYYLVATAGTTTVDGISEWAVGDWILSNGSTWQKIDNSSAPPDAEFIVKTASGQLSAERVLTDTSTVTWDYGTAGQAKAGVPDAAITPAKLSSSSKACGIAIQFGDGVNTGVVATGMEFAWHAPCAGSWTEFYLEADASCSVTVNLKKNGTTIFGVGSTMPTLSSGTSQDMTSMTGVTTAFAKGDAFVARIETLSGTPKRITLTPYYDKA